LGLGDRHFAEIAAEADVVGAGESQDRTIPNGDEGQVVGSTERASDDVLPPRGLPYAG
jgi:hypothetical protein